MQGAGSALQRAFSLSHTAGVWSEHRIGFVGQAMTAIH
jgi:hypothetical protein